MARQPRIEYERAFYHVTSRGNLRSNIFFEEADRGKFVEILKRTRERYRYILHVYVLMDNHYHFLIETPLANLNQLMQNINTSYTVFINRKYRRSGHLFQGRYKAIVIDKDNYLLSLSRYIHLNPVRANIVDSPEQYRWSSYREYVGYLWSGLVNITDTLSCLSDNQKIAMMEYGNFVESGIKDHGNPFNDVRAGVILGKEDFVERITEMIKGKPSGSELPAFKKLYKTIPIDSIVERVSNYYSLSETDLRKRSRRYSDQRKVAIYLSKVMSTEKNPVVAKHFGISPQAVTNVITEIKGMLEESKRLRTELEEIKCIL